MSAARAPILQHVDMNVADFLVAPHKLGERIVEKVSKVKFYRITPIRLYFLDNSLGFGHRDLLEVDN